MMKINVVMVKKVMILCPKSKRNDSDETLMTLMTPMMFLH